MEIKRFALGSLFTNAYLVWDSNKKALLTDPGGDTSEVQNFIEARGLDLKAVLVTHGHSDHILGIESIVKKATDAKAKVEVYIHREDRKMLEDPLKNLSGFMAEPFSSSIPVKEVEDNYRMSIGSLNIIVIHTPGHSPGSVCYLVEESGQKILLSGDTLFAQSIGRTDLPGGNFEKIKESLMKLAELPEDLNVFPGHGPETTIRSEKESNPFWPEVKKG